MLASSWKLFKRCVLVFGVLLSCFAVLECLRAFQTLYELHPIAGYAFVGILVAGFLWLAWYYVRTVSTRPAVLRPVSIENPEQASDRDLRRYAKYILRYLARLEINIVVSDTDREQVRQGFNTLQTRIQTHTNRDEMVAAILAAEEQVLQPMLGSLDEEANRQVRNCTRDVMVGVALSPYKAADLLIVLYRNLSMVIRIIKIYNSRPRLRGQLQILSDTIRVVATVNYINMGKSLLEGLGSKVPFIRTYTDDIVQSIGAGFMTSVAGHAAMDRCRAFRGWNEQEAKNIIRSRVAEFYTDVRDIFKKDILSVIVKRVGDVSKDSMDKIGSVLDEMGTRIGTFVKKPFQTAAATGDTVVTASSSTFKKWFRRKK
jgi:uncharacterized membrane protein YcjF (UPF0283 family)